MGIVTLLIQFYFNKKKVSLCDDRASWPVKIVKIENTRVNVIRK